MLHVAAQALHLAHAARVRQAEMDHDHVHGCAGPVHLHMQ